MLKSLAEFVAMLGHDGDSQPSLPQAPPCDGPGAEGVVFVRNARARRYVLRVRADGVARVTIPRWGSKTEAQAFVARHSDWLAGQRARRAAERGVFRGWRVGSTVMLHGESMTVERINANGQSHLRLGECSFPWPGDAEDVRPHLERHLRRRAEVELPARVWEWAGRLKAPLKRVSIRNQRTRWGSCSARGTVSLNWRIVQVPDWVADYLIIHELTHFFEMNHSARFWRRVEATCPGYARADAWLRANSSQLR